MIYGQNGRPFGTFLFPPTPILLYTSHPYTSLHRISHGIKSNKKLQRHRNAESRNERRWKIQWRNCKNPLCGTHDYTEKAIVTYGKIHLVMLAELLGQMALTGALACAKLCARCARARRAPLLHASASHCAHSSAYPLVWEDNSIWRVPITVITYFIKRVLHIQYKVLRDVYEVKNNVGDINSIGFGLRRFL